VIFWDFLLKNAEQLGFTGREEMYKIVFDGVSNCYSLDSFCLATDNQVNLWMCNLAVDIFIAFLEEIRG